VAGYMPACRLYARKRSPISVLTGLGVEQLIANIAAFISGHGTVEYFVMAALCSRCGHYIVVLWFLIFSSPNLSRRRLDVYHTSTHFVALVRI